MHEGEVDTARSARAEPRQQVYEAARLYYLEHATQAQIAEVLGTSRPTVSRLLATARDTGIVEVRVRTVAESVAEDLCRRLVAGLGLRAAHVAPSDPTGRTDAGALLADGVGLALLGADLRPGDALLVSSGATVYSVARQGLPALPGVLLCPTVGGVEEPEAHYQTNEITRALALEVSGTPVMLYAPAMPEPALHRVLMKDPHVLRVTELWDAARAALLGIGGPPGRRSSIPSAISSAATTLAHAAGDICARPYDSDGRPISFPGSDRLLAIRLDQLRRVEHTIGAAVGAGKVDAILTAVRAGYVNTLVTDIATAELLLTKVERGVDTA